MVAIVDWKKVACLLAGMVAVHQRVEIETVIDNAIKAAEKVNNEEEPEP